MNVMGGKCADCGMIPEKREGFIGMYRRLGIASCFMFHEIMRELSVIGIKASHRDLLIIARSTITITIDI